MNSEYENEFENEQALQQKEQAERAEIENRIKKHLAYGEQLIWYTKQQSVVNTNIPFWVIASFLLPVFLILYFVVFGFFLVFNKIIPLIASFIICVILYIVLHFTLPKLLSKLASEMNCKPNIYAITNKRLLTSCNGGMLSDDLKNIKYVRYFQDENGIGNVYYSNFRDFKVTKSGAICVVGVSRRKNALEIQALYNIDNPQEACEILQNAIIDCADTSNFSNSEPIYKESLTSQNIPSQYSNDEYSHEFFEATEFDENILWTGYAINNTFLNNMFAIFIGSIAFMLCIMYTVITKSVFAVIIAIAMLSAIIYGIYKMVNETKLLIAITDSRLILKKKNGKFTSVNLESIYSINCINKTISIQKLHKRTAINFSGKTQNENSNRNASKPHADYIFKIENGAEDFYNTLLSLTSSNTKQPY